MARYIASNIVQSIVLILGVLVLVFFMVRLTGDPVALMVARDATAEQREAFRVAHGLDRPLLEQFGSYMSAVARGDLGESLRLRLPNTQLIFQRLPATFELAVSALFLALTMAVPLGVTAGMQPHSLWDKLARSLGLAAQTIPTFVLAILLILFFAVGLRWLPTFGRDTLASLVLPTIALAFGSMGQLVLLARSLVLEIRSENFVRTAQSKGLSPRMVAMRHVLHNAAIPLVSVIGVQFTYLLGGSVYIETIFSWPGLGSLLQTAINDSDFPLVQAITIFIALFAVSVNLITNLIYGWIDPRLRTA